MFKGAFTALVTPFKDNRIDEAALRDLIEYQIVNGVSGLVPCGTTGESATLSPKEHNDVVRITIDAAGGRVPVIAGTGSNSTSETIDFTRFAKEEGAAAALLITPYYNKPTQEGLKAHFAAVADAVDIPLILYNVPSRTALNMAPSTVESLCEHKNIAGIKEATADMEQASWIIRSCGDNFSMLSGDDATVLPFISVGGHGVISVVANIAPKAMSELCAASLDGDFKRANQTHYALLPLISALFTETNPIPVKEALHMMGKMTDEIRLPLTRLSASNREALQKALKDFGLI